MTQNNDWCDDPKIFRHSDGGCWWRLVGGMNSLASMRAIHTQGDKIQVSFRNTEMVHTQHTHMVQLWRQTLTRIAHIPYKTIVTSSAFQMHASHPVHAGALSNHGVSFVSWQLFVVSVNVHVPELCPTLITEQKRHTRANTHLHILSHIYARRREKGKV